MKSWKVIHNTLSPTQMNGVVGILSEGGMVVYPTETSYGMAVDATNEQAVNKLLEYKGGRQNKAISIAVADKNMAQDFVEINSMAEHLYNQFLPGPVTVVSKSKGKVVEILESERHTLGVRIPDYDLLLKLIDKFGKPITATSANTSGKKQPYSRQDLLKYTSKKKLMMVDGIIDAGALPYREPSTVVDTTLNEMQVLRQGRVRLGKRAKRVVSRSTEETRQIGFDLMSGYVDKLSTKSLVVALQGELGAGKTQFVKGIAKALGITSTVTSPTYQIMREYNYQCGKLCGKLVHIDTWRLHEGDELMDLGFKSLTIPRNVIAIEWMEKAREVVDEIAKDVVVVWVVIEDGDNKNERVIDYWLEEKLIQ